MAGIDHDHRAGIGWRSRLCRHARGRRGLCVGDCRTQFGPRLRRQRLHEGGAVDFGQFQHQPRRLAVGGFQHVGTGDLRRSRQIEHDPRSAGHHQPVAECLDQPSARGADARRQPEAHLRHVDHHPVGIGEHEGAVGDRLVEVEDKTGLLGITGQAGVGGNREVGDGRRRRRLAVGGLDQASAGTHHCCGAQERGTQQNMVICAARQRFFASGGALFTAIKPQG